MATVLDVATREMTSRMDRAIRRAYVSTRIQVFCYIYAIGRMTGLRDAMRFDGSPMKSVCSLVFC